MVKQKFEHVGSFLRPKALLTAREQFDNGAITREDLTAIENASITTLAKKEIAAGLDVITDGEFRRSYWHLDFFWGFDNVAHTHYGQGYLFADEETRDDTAVLTGKLGFTAENHPELAAYAFIKKIADAENGAVEAKITIPAPAQFLAELLRGNNAAITAEFYPDHKVLLDDIAKVYHEAILALYAVGARTIQLDDCTWGMLVDKDFWDTMAGAGFDLAGIQEDYLYVNNKAIDNLPDDLTINTHICRGNYHSTYATKGAYDTVADVLFAREHAEKYFLEYDNERSGGFEPLAKFPADKVAVLGLITSKNGVLEDRDAVITRIKEATRYLPLEQLYLSTQCGFASTEEGNILSEDDQWTKLALVKSIIDEVWA
ncbi:5-methyltetrahydropteroyltriglutamate--homocysteine S-methyltransferase [Pseudolactococcus insecticola]|uniref:5-methyltetrahydropteroyltriglutamate--homocysteine methyltransferase n=1 Tax=Pseudolactococcus insecticola TaxID=2709158 RepID=A0A6A0B4J6_9LACT|nr:5-methyltetrahydropteroyltriglutamate--homocysteine S-methyltransferase [Lactococcus insecticola]GFH40280.1 5-methyltetrahydropteroyltriglutamate--homocysteine methyltransferase [Lactococcus insecticola]